MTVFTVLYKKKDGSNHILEIEAPNWNDAAGKAKDDIVPDPDVIWVKIFPEGMILKR